MKEVNFTPTAKATIEERWESFKNAMVKPDISEAEIETIRKIFYSGEASMYAFIMNVIATENTDNMHVIFSRTEAELSEHLESPELDS